MASTALGRLKEHHLHLHLIFVIYLGFNQLFCVQITYLSTKHQNKYTNTRGMKGFRLLDFRPQLELEIGGNLIGNIFLAFR